jgi:heterodisulfide reductase subunit C
MEAEKETAVFSARVCATPGGEHLRRCYACGTCVSRCLVQKRLDPAYNPRRLLKKAALDLEHEALVDPTVWLCSACDLCFAGCPQQIHISEVLLAIRRLALAAGYGSSVQPAQVNPLTCVACGLCVSACPYQAIQLAEVKVLGRDKRIACVDSSLCMGCGLCGALCRSASIEVTANCSNQALMDELRDWLAQAASEE